MMDIARALDSLVPSALFAGTFQENSWTQYDMLDWRDERPKPTRAALEAKHKEFAALDRAEARQRALEASVEKYKLKAALAQAEAENDAEMVLVIDRRLSLLDDLGPKEDAL